MIGNVIQSKFLELTDYPAAAAMSFILMAGILVAVALYARARRDGEADRDRGLSNVAVAREPTRAVATASGLSCGTTS